MLYNFITQTGQLSLATGNLTELAYMFFMANKQTSQTSYLFYIGIDRSTKVFIIYQAYRHKYSLEVSRLGI